jgi:hypothetical protein
MRRAVPAPRRSGALRAALRNPAAGRCPRCGAPVLVTPDGELLEPEPHPLAITLPDGSRITARQAADVLTGRAAPIGHHPHHERGYGCHPAAARQLALFAA